MGANRFRSIVWVALAALLFGCASSPAKVESPPPESSVQSLLAETDDLGAVAEEALNMAQRLGTGRVLVVFDIDNTLLAMEQGLGSDQWYYWQKALAQDDPCSAQIVSNRLKVQGALYFASGMRPTQPDAAAQVKRLQDAGLKVIALTSRGPDFRLQTFRELRRNDLSFWPSALPPARGFPGSFIPEGGERESRYEEGVFLTAGQDKGDMLIALLKKTGSPPPAVIVMADDKQENLQAVIDAYENSDTAVRAWRYSREDANVASLDTDEAAAMWSMARPALTKLELLFGKDNFDLPPHVVREGCGVMDIQ